MKLVLIGDGQSPHLLKWARALAPHVELFAASSRGFSPGFNDLMPSHRRLALDTNPAFEGGNAALLLSLPRLGAWLSRIDADWLHAHYLSSHGSLAWLARGLWRLRAGLIGSAWGSDILVTPERSLWLRALTRRVLRACDLCTSDSQHMAARMAELGAGEVMTFPFGLEQLPPAPHADAANAQRFFANRGLEPIYAPQRVLQTFASIARDWPAAELVVSNDGSLLPALQAQAVALGLGARVTFVGRLDAEAMVSQYRRARWYLSLPVSDSVSVSVLEALAHGCIPLLSDLPANRELVRDGDNGVIVADGGSLGASQLEPLAARAQAIADANHAWVAEHALFAPAVERFVARLQELHAQRCR